MLADERRRRILDWLERAQSATVSELAVMFGASESTIRRDLQELDEQGLLKRTHGGAVPLEMAGFEATIQEKHAQRLAEKVQIAKRALDMIRPGDTVLLDSGSTTLQIARLLPDMDVTVVTNSLAIAQELSTYQRVQLVVLGGELRTTTGAMVGPFTEMLLAQLHVDRLFLGANGVDFVHGITTPNAVEAATKRAMMRAAREVVLVADHSKLRQRSLVKICDMGDVDTFITDAPLSATDLERLAHETVCVQFAGEAQQGD
ncbi:DeoR family transcriptional regulator [Alicyclobacillus contaminans]|uniref:DeoR/GlpR family DNA-binding transcription regulator n=1 Tax=Alicyclobacillus contaminans TaxID=392016 RepID=UPI0003F89BC0|nr:DeoR/GlpR family DNA-binding transcription regulator [Alicyclobacillus contaminans]GMA49447.1 DeoR family transcriptional regulator [Alicyclobacillus contaminans]